MGRVHQIETTRSEKIRVLHELLSVSIRGGNSGVDATAAHFSISYPILDEGKAMVGHMQLVSHSSHSRDLHLSDLHIGLHLSC